MVTTSIEIVEQQIQNSSNKKFLKQDANLGIAFDGDGDRLIMVDHLGEKVDGDELVYIIANAWKKQW